MQTHPLWRMYFSQCQLDLISCTGVTRRGGCYLMHKVQSCRWLPLRIMQLMRLTGRMPPAQWATMQHLGLSFQGDVAHWSCTHTSMQWICICGQTQLPCILKGRDTHSTRHTSANPRAHQLYWDDWEMATVPCSESWLPLDWNRSLGWLLDWQSIM